MIPESFILQLKQSVDIADIMSSYVNIKREGRNKKCLCPFHSEKTPSMVIYQDTQSFYCFGCGAGGDAFTFIKKIENLEYVEAIKLIAKRAGVAVPEDYADDNISRLKTRIYEANREAARFFHNYLYNENTNPGLEYLRSRNLTDATIKNFGLGYAPNSWDELLKHLKSKGFSFEELTAAYLISKNKSGGYYDQFRNRVMFPIIDLRGNVIGFGGRVLDDSKPKYLNTAETLVFHKKLNLYCLNFAKTNIKDKIILAEGYLDVIAIYQAGLKNVVATLGTAITPEQARLISNYAKEVVIAYDSDEAGQKATHKAINLLSEVGLSTRIISMEGAKDPDEFINKFGTTRFRMIIEGANNAFDFELLKLKSKYDIETETGKISYLKDAVFVLSEISNPIEREVYCSKVANEVSISKTNIEQQVNSLRNKKSNTIKKQQYKELITNKVNYNDKINTERMAHLKQAKAEEGIIFYLFKNPDYYNYLIRKISANDFITDFNRRVLKILLDAFEMGSEFDLTLFATDFSDEEMGKISGIIAKNEQNILNETILNDYIKVILEHKTLKTDEQKKEMDPMELFEYIKNKKSRDK